MACYGTQSFRSTAGVYTYEFLNRMFETTLDIFGTGVTGPEIGFKSDAYDECYACQSATSTNPNQNIFISHAQQV